MNTRPVSVDANPLRDNGELTKRVDVAAAGGLFVMAISPDRLTEPEHARIASSREIPSGPAITSTTRVSTVVYFSNEQSCSVTAYRVDHANGTLSSVQTTSTLPPLALPETSDPRGGGVFSSRIDARNVPSHGDKRIGERQAL